MTTEESIEEDLSYEPSSEVDSVYEFDASRYFDFCLPESSSDTERAERWFHVAGYYPPSRFYFKSKVIINTQETNDDEMKGKTMVNNGEVLEETPKAKPKAAATQKSGGSKTRSSSTLMKPTASHLARLNLLAATQNDNEATKRQKLESGYLRKVAHLKHQSSLLHKSSQKGGLSSPGAKALHHSKLSVTVPREPRLETHRRAQWRRFKSRYDLTSSDHITSGGTNIIQSSVIQEKNSRVTFNAETKMRTQKSPISQDYKSSNEKKLLQHPPVELFSKLTLKCQMHSDEESQPNQHH